MLLKLRVLEEALVQVSQRYHIVATELANLKNKPDNEPAYTATIDELGKQLNQTQMAMKTLQEEHQTLQATLAEKLKQIQLLNEENSLLSQQNKELKDKNRLAIERAETIQEWLYNIDNAKI